jgi:magnesium transporter
MAQPDTAANLATDRVPTAAPDDAADDVRAAVAGRAHDEAGAVAVVDGGVLAGLVPLERLLAAAPATPVGELMDADPPVVAADADPRRAAWTAAAHGQATIAVVGADGRFRGLIPPPRLLSVLSAAHDEDLARIGGYLAGAAQARDAAREPVARRLWHRLPWLLIGLVGAMASAAIVGAFEEQLERKVLLAFFVPGVVYMADAVGTQTETVLIRGLAAGVGVRSVLRREVLTGIVVGAVMAVAFLVFALVVWGDGEVAAAVALSLLASCSIATLVAMVLPWAFHRLGIDPAFGSGPLATVVQDLLSIAVYFAVALAVVG